MCSNRFAAGLSYINMYIPTPRNSLLASWTLTSIFLLLQLHFIGHEFVVNYALEGTSVCVYI